VLLVIDVGNTETVIGLYARGDSDPALDPEESVGVGIGTERDPSAPTGLTHHWRLSTVPSRTPDEHAVLLTQLLDLEGLDIATSVTGIAVSSSVPHVTGELRQMAQRWFSALPCVVLGPGTKSGMPILYDNPKEVGADRIANAVGAYDLYGGPCVVIDMGTATTVEAISAAGEYLAAAGGDGRAPPRHRAVHGRVDRIGDPLRLRSPGRRVGPPFHGGAGTVDRGGHGRAQRPDRAPFGHHRARRALVDPARAAHRLRPQRVGLILGLIPDTLFTGS
jgi:pantothenate kinase type III